MRLFFIIGALLTGVGVSSLRSSAAIPQDWYYTGGPLRGSLKSDRPLPLYDGDAEHLWNRLFAVFYTRPSELSSPLDYPADSTDLDEYDRKRRRGELRQGPAVKRLEGGDTTSFLAWPRTRYYSEPATFERANKLLDEFIESHGERLVDDPLKRAFFQRDLWAVFDHLINQNIDRYGDVELAKRRSAGSRYEVGNDELQFDDPSVFRRRETLCRKLATIIKRLALPKAAIQALPDTYAAAIRSGHFPARHDFDPGPDYLPPGLLTRPDEWVEIDNSAEPLHVGKREGHLGLVTSNIRGRSYYRIFMRFPGGRQAVEDYLKYLQQDGVDWPKTGRQGYIALKPDVRQIPVGTEAAIVQFMIVLDDHLEPVATQVVESARVSVYKNVDGAPDPKTNIGRGANFRLYVARRRLLFDKLNQGGLERVPDNAPVYTVLLNGSQDWGLSARQQTVAQSCVGCHMHERNRIGVFSLNTIFCFVPELGMPGVIIPIGSGDLRTYSKAERTLCWKVGLEDYLRLVEYARDARPTP